MTLNENKGANSNIRAVVFDLGNVLIAADDTRAFTNWATATGLPVAHLERIFNADTHYKRMECGEIDIAQYHLLLTEENDLSISFDDFLACWNSVLGPILPGVQEMVTNLASSVRLACLTNTCKVHADIWRPGCGELFKDFDRVFCSYEMGVRKPDPAAFEAVIEWLDLPPESVAFVDDRAENVAAANKLGLAGVCAFGASEAVAGLSKLGLEL